MLLNLGLGLLATLVFLVPAAAVALAHRPHGPSTDAPSPLPHLLIGLGWGFGLAPFCAFTYAVFLNEALTVWTTVAAALGVTAGALALFVAHGRTIPDGLRHRTGWRALRPVLLVSFGVFVFYLFKFDESTFFLESCIHRVVMQTLKATPNPIDVLASNADDQRLGNTAVISGFVVLYRELGFRLIYAFCGFAMTLGGYALGLRALGSRGAAWFLALALPLNPYVASIPLLDENLLTLGYCSLLMPLLFGAPRPGATSRFLPADLAPAHVGALFGLAVMMRHELALSGFALVFLALRHPAPRLRPFLWAFIPFNLVTLVCHVHHWLALGSLLKFEIYGQIPSFEHRVIGSYPGLLQWPFAESVIRTPWNPFPTFLMWPTYLADHLGLVVFGALLLGAGLLFLRDRPQATFWALWFAPLYVGLSLQENWDVPNKMGVIYILFHPLLLWAWTGLASAAAAPRRTGVLLLALVGLLWVGARSLRSLEVPEDRRYYEAWPGEREEERAYVDWARDRATDVWPWPDLGRLGPARQLFHPHKVHSLLDAIRAPRLNPEPTAYGFFAGEHIDATAQPLVLELDLSERLLDRGTPWVRVLADGATQVDVDLTLPGPPSVVANLALSWTPRPVSLLLTPGQAPRTAIQLIFEPWDPSPERLEFLADRYHRGLMMNLAWTAEDLARARTVTTTGPIVRLRVFPGPLSVVESVNNAGQNYLQWRTHVSSSTPLALDGPRVVFHN